MVGRAAPAVHVGSVAGGGRHK